MAGNRVVSSQDTIDLKGKVFQGTCGWSDSSIVKCGKFYPSSVKTTEDRLLHYSRFFPCVECDSSNYAIPSPAAVEKWIKCVPAGFKFHFKAFGFFTRKSVPLSVLPHIVRDELPENFTRQHSSVTWDELTQAQLGKLWDKYNSALLPAYQKNKLGVVVFQFHIGFHPTDENKRHVVECRKYLDVHYPMAAEFRSRVWFSVENLSTTLDWLNQHNIGLVVADDLESELYVKSSSVSNEKNSVSDRGGVVPIVMELGSCDFGYIRVHRRTGKDRILREQEIKSWGERLRSPELQSKIQGPIYFMWGTDHEDQPIINSKNLTKEIGTLAFDWKNKISNTGMLRFCSKAAQGNHTAQKTKAVLQNEDDDDDEKRAAFLKGTVRSEIGLSEAAINDEVERGGNSSLPLLASPRSESTKISSSGSAKKRTLSSAGSTSPKKRQTSTGIRGRNSTPTNQRMISDFFKK